MVSQLPVYTIDAFRSADEHADFYANTLNPHVAGHTFTNLPHKHDFYFVMLVTKGSGTHEIDFTKYTVKPGCIFIMKPGQMHYWKLSKNIDGYIFFHSKMFYEEEFTGLKLRDYPFYASYQAASMMMANDPAELKMLMGEIVNEFRDNNAYRQQSLHALVNLVYVKLSRSYKLNKTAKSQVYLQTAFEFEKLLDQHFKEKRSANDYAKLLNITEKHLNRIVRKCFNKTSTQLIAERLVLEAKRMLIHSNKQVTQIAYDLGYSDKSYFVRFFKKNAGETPLTFLERYKRRK